jgi:DNA polymerase III alpha subunit
MIDLGDRLILSDGTVLCRDAALVELLYQGKSIDHAIAIPSEDIEAHDKADRLLDTNYGSIETATEPLYEGVRWCDHWNTPEPYATLDIEGFCISRCSDQEEILRVQEELKLFTERDMIGALRHLCYLVDHWRSRGIVWGVGRGSSVSSFVLYIIGINRINPMQFGLDIEEFLK